MHVLDRLGSTRDCLALAPLGRHLKPFGRERRRQRHSSALGLPSGAGDRRSARPMSSILRRALCVASLLASWCWAFQCTSDERLGPTVASAQKGIALDDSTLRWCTSQIPRLWPNAGEPMTSIRLFKAWDAKWGEEGRESAWNGLVAYVVQSNAKVFIGTEITCDEEADDASWEWTKQLLQRLHPEHVMGLAIGNELELLQFKGQDMVPCVSCRLLLASSMPICCRHSPLCFVAQSGRLLPARSADRVISAEVSAHGPELVWSIEMGGGGPDFPNSRR